ncbi:Long-chain-fatty-acid--CoA ligase [subsurface metagenome]
MNKIGSKGGKIGSIGTPLDFIEIKIVNSEDKELPPGPNNVGEIIVRRKSGELFEYYKQPENEDVRIGDNKWVYTNDFGYMDHDGYIYFKGKGNEIILKGDEVIFAKDIERIANSHPHIIESAVIPVSNGNNIDLKITAVKVQNRSITPEELSDYLYHNIAFEHVPRYIEIIDKLPKGTATEVLKEILKEDWDKGYYYSNMWDTKIHDFLEK